MKLPRPDDRGIFSQRFVGSGIPPKRKFLRSTSRTGVLGVSRSGIKLNNWLIVILLLLFSVPAVLALLKNGFYEPHDVNNIANIYEMVRAISSGQIPPRWGPDFSWNFGYPLFNFYYVLPFYLAAVGFWIFGTLTFAFKFVFILSAIASVFSMYLFLREFLGKFPSFVGSLVYLYTPYRAVQIYVRGAIGEALVMAILPLVAWGIIKVIRNPKNGKIIALSSFILALFLLSHNLLPLLSAVFLLILALIFISSEGKRIQGTLSVLLMGILGIGISAYYLIPAILEQKLISDATPFALYDHFPFLKQLIIPSWGYGASLWGPNDGMSFQVGVINLFAVLIFVLILLFYRKSLRERQILTISLWAFGGFAISFIMMNVRTYPIWKLIPFNNLIQFPWRLLFLTTFFTSILAAISVEVFPKAGKVIGIVFVGGALALIFNYFQPSKIVQKSDKDYLSRFFPGSKEYLNYSEDYLLLTKWTKERPKAQPSSKIEVDKNASISNIKEITPVNWAAEISAKKETEVIFNSYYFPGWYAKIDSKETVIANKLPHGEIVAKIPEGKHTVNFFWKETPLRRFSDFVTIISLISVIALPFMLQFTRERDRV